MICLGGSDIKATKFIEHLIFLLSGTTENVSSDNVTASLPLFPDYYL